MMGIGIVAGICLAVVLYLALAPNLAEYHHCMVTTVDHSICNSLK